jgi:hypothetical protein
MTDNLIKIGESDFWNKIHDRHQDKGGIYKLIAINNGQRIPIKRFLGIDPEGVLYIGKANSFIDRVIKLKTSIDPDYNGQGHICGRRYKSNPNIAKQFPFDNLFMELHETTEPKERESELLREYFVKFGEAPPLNATY